MNEITFWFLVFAVVFFLLVVGLLILFSVLSWNIPVTILRFTGDKRRPMVIHRKARKRTFKGVTQLRVKGYKNPIRDFLAENYWPSAKGKYGALVLWELEDGWLTPTIPRKVKLSTEERRAVEEAITTLKKVGAVEFEYNPEMHHKLKLKIVDDVEAEYLVEQLAREDKQYTGGLFAFLDKYGVHLTFVLLGAFALVGFLVYLDKAPNLGAQCLAQLGEVVKEDFLTKVAGAATSAPPG